MDGTASPSDRRDGHEPGSEDDSVTPVPGGERARLAAGLRGLMGNMRATSPQRPPEPTDDPAPALRVDDPRDQQTEEPVIDCAARLHICRAVCCRLSVVLSAEEVEAGRLRWDADQPYRLVRDDDGQCAHIDRPTLRCTVYADRPRPCHSYTCAGDRRIWRDFEGMVLNSEWIEANLRPGQPTLVQLEPLRRDRQ